MANFAKLNESGEVIDIIAIRNEDTLDSEGQESEAVGIAFLQSLFGSDTSWKQTSYNDNIRTRYAEIGGTYDSSRDAFIPEGPPFPSWTLNTTTLDWESPLGPQPTRTAEQIASRTYYYWDEDAYQADNTTGWATSTYS